MTLSYSAINCNDFYHLWTSASSLFTAHLTYPRNKYNFVSMQAMITLTHDYHGFILCKLVIELNTTYINMILKPVDWVGDGICPSTFSSGSYSEQVSNSCYSI